ncbi:MAG: 3-deoxy-manno-octulosonate cytidylyltransferase, partial [Chitinophagaceae bacterium]
FSEISSFGGKVIKSLKEHESGSDRIAEVVEKMEVDVIVNVQGDEPFMERKPLADLLHAFSDDTVQVASLMHRIFVDEEVRNPNIVKVVVDNNNFSLMFSRSVIPHKRNADTEADYFRHIGVYAYRKEALMQFIQWPVGKLENIEKLEQLRYLENGIKIKMIETDKLSMGIDTPEDLDKAKQFLAQLMG